MEPGRVSTFRNFNDPFNSDFDNGVVSCVGEIRSSKRSNNDSHPHAAYAPSVNSMRGGKTGGGDGVL